MKKLKPNKVVVNDKEYYFVTAPRTYSAIVLTDSEGNYEDDDYSLTLINKRIITRENKKTIKELCEIVKGIIERSPKEDIEYMIKLNEEKHNRIIN